MSDDSSFVPGQRVRIIHPPFPVRLTCLSGEIIAPDRSWRGFYLVRLDVPGEFEDAGAPMFLREIRVADDNLEPA